MVLTPYDKQRPILVKELQVEGNKWVSKYAPGGSSKKESGRAFYNALSELLGHIAFNGLAPMRPSLVVRTRRVPRRRVYSPQSSPLRPRTSVMMPRQPEGYRGASLLVLWGALCLDDNGPAMGACIHCCRRKWRTTWLPPRPSLLRDGECSSLHVVNELAGKTRTQVPSAQLIESNHLSCGICLVVLSNSKHVWG
jgi:hypothetical protein